VISLRWARSSSLQVTGRNDANGRTVTARRREPACFVSRSLVCRLPVVGPSPGPVRPQVM